MREITVATVQMKPELGNSENNLVKMSDFVSKITSQQKVDLIVFPELITSGYELGVRFTELAQRVPGPAINLMAQRAADAGVYIAFGLATKEKVESIIYNTAVLVGPEGELLGTYNKVHLRGEERMAFREGHKMPVIDTGEIGKVGLMLGWDSGLPGSSTQHGAGWRGTAVRPGKLGNRLHRRVENLCPRPCLRERDVPGGGEPRRGRCDDELWRREHDRGAAWQGLRLIGNRSRADGSARPCANPRARRDDHSCRCAGSQERGRGRDQERRRGKEGWRGQAGNRARATG